MKTKIIIAALTMAMSVSASAEVLRKKAIICDTPWQLEKVLAAASTGNGTFMNVIKNVGCQLNKNDLNVVPMMQWPGQEMMVKVMVSDPRYPKLAGLEVWTDLIFSSILRACWRFLIAASATLSRFTALLLTIDNLHSFANSVVKI